MAYPTDASCGGTCWGAGQPSATTVTGGQVLLFYHQSARLPTDGEVRRLVDLSSFDGNLPPTSLGPAASSKGPVIDYGVPPVTLSTVGLLDTRDGVSAIQAAQLANVSIAYNAARDVFVIVRDGEVRLPSDVVSDRWQVAAIEGTYVWIGGGTWQVLATRDGPGSFATNPPHRYANNAGIQRSVWGGFYDSGWLEVFPTRMIGGSGGGSDLWSYRMNTTYGTLAP